MQDYVEVYSGVAAQLLLIFCVCTNFPMVQFWFYFCLFACLNHKIFSKLPAELKVMPNIFLQHSWNWHFIGCFIAMLKLDFMMPKTFQPFMKIPFLIRRINWYIFINRFEKVLRYWLISSLMNRPESKHCSL